jgi:DNA-binding NarL/FixJ family response regulator
VAAPLLILFSPYLTSSEQESMLISKQLKNAKEMATKNEAAASEQLPSFWPNLTNQEKKVYEQLILGHTDAEIAKRLYVTRHTIKFHTRNILRKAAVTNRRKLPVVTLHKNNEDIETGV